MRFRSPSVALAVVTLAACTADRAAEPVTPPVDAAIKAYYSDRALEENAFCTTPYIDRITQSRVVEDNDRQLVLDVRYFFRSQAGPSSDDITMFNRCEGFASRTFTFDRSGGGLSLAGMTGDQRQQ
jgi:hypothetical protein